MSEHPATALAGCFAVCAIRIASLLRTMVRRGYDRAMPYTSQGYMTYDDIREVEADMDRGSIDIQMDDPPEWFETIHAGDATCRVCGQALWSHESVTVMRASSEIFRCVDADGEAHEEDYAEGVW